MPRKYFTIFLIVLTCFQCIEHLNSQEYNIKYVNVSPIEGIENPVVTCVYQDHYGFTWFGSLNGIYRWDGIRAKHYYHIAGDSSSVPYDLVISFLFEDKESNLWFGTLGQGALKYNRLEDNFSLLPLNENNPQVMEARWVTRACQDEQGNIWGLGMTNRLFYYQLNNKDSKPIELQSVTTNPNNPANNILSIVPDQSGSFFWVGTSDGLYKLNIANKKFVQVQIYQSEKKQPQTNAVRSIIQDNDSILWFATQNELIKLQLNNNKIKTYFRLTGHDINPGGEIIEEIINCPISNQKNIWVFSKRGIYRVNKSTGSIEKYIVKNRENLFESSEFISAEKGRFIDKNGFLWIATDNMGAAVIDLNDKPFEHYLITGKDGKKVPDGATSFFIDNRKNLWVGTGFSGIFQFDPNMNLINHFKYDATNPNSLTNNFIYSSIETGNGKFWIGTNNGLNRLNINDNKIDHYLQKPIDYKGNLPNVRSAELFYDSTGRLWVGTTQGVYFTDNPDTERVTFTHYDSVSYYFCLIQHIFNDRNSDIWFASPTEHGIYRLTNGINGKQQIINYTIDPGNPDSFITDGAMCIYEDKSGIFWLGTTKGIYKWDRSENTFKHYHKGNGLGANMIYWLFGDNRGNLWLSTEAGLIRFNPSFDDERMSKVFTYKDGLPFEEIYPYRYYKSQDGIFYIGGRRGSGNGFYRFNPDDIRENRHVPPVVVTNFKVNDIPFQFDTNLLLKKYVELDYDQNFFSFEFAALDYTDPEKNQYAYFLDGLEEGWNYVGNRNFANYTDVSPGKYVFRVKGSNNDGYWNEDGAKITVLVTPPPWRTWWAFTIYVLIILGIIFSISYYYIRRQQLLHELKHLDEEKKIMAAKFLIEGQEDERKRVANELHDGLGVLLSTAKIQVSSIKKDDPENKSLLEKAAKLLEQATMDVRKISHNMMPGLLMKFGLYEAIGDLLDKINETGDLCASINVTGIEDRLSEKMEIMLYRIIQELINNTLKHANAKSIQISMHVSPEQINITYFDDGIGFKIESMTDQESLGLQSIHSRLNFLNGELNFKSKKGEGVIFDMKIPKPKMATDS